MPACIARQLRLVARRRLRPAAAPRRGAARAGDAACRQLLTPGGSCCPQHTHSTQDTHHTRTLHAPQPSPALSSATTTPTSRQCAPTRAATRRSATSAAACSCSTPLATAARAARAGTRARPRPAARRAGRPTDATPGSYAGTRCGGGAAGSCGWQLSLPGVFGSCRCQACLAAAGDTRPVHAAAGAHKPPTAALDIPSTTLLSLAAPQDGCGSGCSAYAKQFKEPVAYGSKLPHAFWGNWGSCQGDKWGFGMCSLKVVADVKNPPVTSSGECVKDGSPQLVSCFVPLFCCTAAARWCSRCSSVNV